MKLDKIKEELQNLYWSRNSRERIILITAVIAVPLTLTYLGVYGLIKFNGDQKAYTNKIQEAYLPTLENVERYKFLKAKLEKVLEENINSRLDVAEASGAIDKVVKDSVGNKDYRFTKEEKFEELPFAGSKKAGTTLEFQSLSLEEIVKLLYNFDVSDKPIFVGNVEIFKNRSSTNTFKLRLEVFTIQKVA